MQKQIFNHKTYTEKLSAIFVIKRIWKLMMLGSEIYESPQRPATRLCIVSGRLLWARPLHFWGSKGSANIIVESSWSGSQSNRTFWPSPLVAMWEGGAGVWWPAEQRERPGWCQSNIQSVGLKSIKTIFLIIYNHFVLRILRFCGLSNKKTKKVTKTYWWDLLKFCFFYYL